MDAIKDVLEGQNAELGHSFERIREYSERKLWFQLSGELESLFRALPYEPWATETARMLFTQVVLLYEDQIRPENMAMILCLFENLLINDGEMSEVIGIFEAQLTQPMWNLRSQFKDLLRAELAFARLWGTEDAAIIGEVRAAVTELIAMCDKTPDVSPLIARAIYKAAVLVAIKIIKEPKEILSCAEKFNTFDHCITLDLHPSVQDEFAWAICHAILSGESIWDFLHILEFKVLKTSEESNPQLKKVIELARAVGAGDVLRVKAMAESLQVDRDQIIRKTQLIAIMRYIFALPVGKRNNVSMETLRLEIAAKTLDDIRDLLLEMLGLGLIEGRINLLEHTLSVRRIMSVHLDMDGLVALREQMKAFGARITQASRELSGAWGRAESAQSLAAFHMG